MAGQMGPTIVLDKSALQALSHEELSFLGKHYSLIVPHVLLLEILGDLKKEKKEKPSTEVVQGLAKKIRGLTVRHNIWYRELCIGNLLGHSVEMQQVPIIQGKTAFTETGEKYYWSQDPPEALALLNWKNGDFTEAEHNLAERWRVATKSLDLAAFRDKFRKLESIPKVRTVPDLLKAIEKITQNATRNPEMQREYMFDLIESFGGTEQLKEKVYARWYKLGLPPFYIFAPYAYFCFCLTQAFQLGVIRDIIGTRATNRVDLEYLFYTPFAMAFSSNDKFHKNLWPHLLKPDQFFVPLEDLKADLNRLYQEWDGLSPEEQEQREYDYGSRPPQISDSITHKIWQKRMRPWGGPGSGNIASKLTPEEKSELIEQCLRLKNPYMS